MNRYSLYILFVCAGLAMVSATEPCAAELSDAAVKARMAGVTPLKGVTPAQWRVIWTEDPATTATISWSTAEMGTRHRVYYDTESHVGDLTAYGHTMIAHRNGRYSREDEDDGPEAFYHHVRITELKPATNYYFVIASDHEVTKEFYFTTAPDDDRPFSIIIGGDSRSGHLTRSRINLIMARYAKERPTLYAFAHAGDYIVDGMEWEDWVLWLSHHELIVTETGRILPIIPTRGNHDDGPLFNEIFDRPGQRGQNYYATRLSRTVALVTLNTEITAGGTQRRWLERQLKTLRPVMRWLIAQYHRPLYPAVKKPASAKPHWTPLFDQYNLDMAYEADGHTIKRTLPIRGDRPDPSGVVYVGEGGLGVRQRSPKPGRWYLRAPGMTDKGHHIVLMDFTPTMMRYRVIMVDETVLDTYTFRPRINPVQMYAEPAEF